MSEMLVKCVQCGREQRPDAGRAMAGGWATCCGQTMRLESTAEFIKSIETSVPWAESPFGAVETDYDRP